MDLRKQLERYGGSAPASDIVVPALCLYGAKKSAAKISELDKREVMVH